ncbi:unnamed protein product, partial [Staurois parvus]
RSRPPRHPSCGNGRRQWRVAGGKDNRVVGQAGLTTTGQNGTGQQTRITGHGPGSATEDQIKGEHKEWSSHKPNQIPGESRESEQNRAVATQRHKCKEHVRTKGLYVISHTPLGMDLRDL